MKLKYDIDTIDRLKKIQRIDLNISSQVLFVEVMESLDILFKPRFEDSKWLIKIKLLVLLKLFYLFIYLNLFY